MSPWWCVCTLYLSYARWSYRRWLGSLLFCACSMCNVNCLSAITSYCLLIPWKNEMDGTRLSATTVSGGGVENNCIVLLLRTTFFWREKWNGPCDHIRSGWSRCWIVFFFLANSYCTFVANYIFFSQKNETDHVIHIHGEWRQCWNNDCIFVANYFLF